MPAKDISLGTRVEITKKYARAYMAASKAQKSKILDSVVEITGWNRDHARQRLSRRGQPRRRDRPTTVVPVVDRRGRKRKYSYDALKVLERIWSVSGGLCGKYLAASMGEWVASMEAAGDLVTGAGRYSTQVRAELCTMSAASIDRYLAPVRRRQLRGKASTKPGALLRNSITIRKAGDEVETEPGFFEVDTVAHCGPTLQGEFARSVNFTDVSTGWVFTQAVRNNASVHVLSAFNTLVDTVPFMVTGVDCDNGSEFINYNLVDWAGKRQIFFTRCRPYKKNDQATVESKTYHLVRRYGFYYRYDTPAELKLLNQLWTLVNDRMNFFTPTKKPIGWATDRVGRRKRLYDTPVSPYQRLLGSGVLSPAQQAELVAYKNSLSPVQIAHQIDRLQQRLIKLASQKTHQLTSEITTEQRRLPNPHGIIIHPTAS